MALFQFILEEVEGQGEDAQTRPKEKTKERRERNKRAAATVAAGAVARDETREIPSLGRVEEAEDRDVNHNM